MEKILLILLFFGIILFFAYLYDKFIGDPLIRKNIKNHNKKENQEYIRLGLNPKKDDPNSIQNKIDHLKFKINYTNVCISKLNDEKENLVKKENLLSQYNLYCKKFENLKDKGLSLIENDLAEMCNSCGTLKHIPLEFGSFGKKRSTDPFSSGCPGCGKGAEGVEILQIRADHYIKSYTGPFFKLELPKTHPKHPDYSYSSDYHRLNLDFDLYLRNLPRYRR